MKNNDLLAKGIMAIVLGGIVFRSIQSLKYNRRQDISDDVIDMEVEELENGE